MGLYINEKRVLKFIVANPAVTITPDNLAEVITGYTKLTSEAAREGIECAVSSKFLIPPKEKGENYIITLKGKRHVKRGWIGLGDQFIGSFKSNFIAIAALIVAIFALFRQT